MKNKKIVLLCYSSDVGKNPNFSKSFISSTPINDYLSELLLRLSHSFFKYNMCPSSSYKKIPHRYFSSDLETDFFGGYHLFRFAPFRKVSFFLSLFRLKMFLYTLKPDDTLICYHSISYAKVVSQARKIRKFHLCLFAGEIYEKATALTKKQIRDEKLLISSADCFYANGPGMVSAIKELQPDKPVGCIYGTFSPLHSRKPDRNGFHNVVYAGSFNEMKGGLNKILKCAHFLDSSYWIHILGYSDESGIARLRTLISKTLTDCTCKITYDGVFFGSKFTEILSSFDVGFSFLEPGPYRNVSFPSKVMKYLSVGLEVVSNPIDVLLSSELAPLIHFSEDESDEKMAASIVEASLKQKNDFSKISSLDDSFFRFFSASL